jgi:tetratricopeptide (TPR) repeat protein
MAADFESIKPSYKFLIFFTIITLFAGSFLVHRKLDNFPSPLKTMEVAMYIPSGNFLKHVTFGFNQVIADYFWIKTVGYFGEHLMSDRQYPWLYPMLDLVTTLDPQFIWPYYFGGITLSLEAKQVEQSNLILKKAIYYHPDAWHFLFYLGFNYWYHDNNLLVAATYLKRAAMNPKAPRYLKTFPARLYSEAGQKDAAIQFLLEMKKNTQDIHMRSEIEKRIEEILKGKMKGLHKPKTRFQ